MRCFKLALLTLALTASTAHAGAPLRLQLRTRLDAARSAITGKPRAHAVGSTVSTDESSPHGSVAHAYRVGSRGELSLQARITRHGDGDEIRAHVTEQFDGSRGLRTRETLTFNADRSSTQEHTAFTGMGGTRTASQTKTRRFREDGSLEAHAQLDHATGLRRTEVFGKDGAITITHSRVTHDHEGLEHEEILSTSKP